MHTGNADTVLQTQRLILRHWRAEDLPAFAELNADPRVMEFFPNRLTPEESHAVAQRIMAQLADWGFGLWALEIPGQTPFAGFVGLTKPRFEAHFTPCVEIGWRLGFAWWGQGYATEAAQAALAFGFERLGLSEIVAMTAVANERSKRVMHKLGMTCDPADDFDHPMVAEGSTLRRHVLYRKRAPRL